MGANRTAGIIFSFLLFTLLAFPVNCIHANTDSLLFTLAKAPDSSKYSLLKELTISFRESNVDSAMLFADQGINLAKKYHRTDMLGEFMDLKGHIYERKGDINSAIASFEEAHNYFVLTGKADEAVRSLSNLGAMLNDNGKYNEAGIQLFRALKEAEEQNLVNIRATIFTNIGLLFFNQEDWDKSIYYYQKSIQIRRQNNDLDGLALLYNNIGIAYYYKGLLDSVLFNFERSLDMYVALGNKLGQTRPLSNIGEIYYLKGDFDKALEYYNKSLDIERELNYRQGMSRSLLDIGVLYADLKKFDKALAYQYEGLMITKETGSVSRLKDANHYLFETYQKMGKPDSALKYFTNYSNLKDSILSLEKQKQINELEKIYETDKKEQQIKLQTIRLHNDKLILIALSLILVLSLGLAFQIWRAYRQKHKINAELEIKNKQLQDSHRQITNSITYASVIQAAILPPYDLFKNTFPKHFILFKPKDIVSGDFYWITQKENQVIIAVADCTGHGVPGAFMSMLGITLLNEIINIYGQTSTDEILNTLRKKIIESLRQKERLNDAHDGLDIALCSYDTETKMLEFSGAYLPILIMRIGELIKLDGDKMPIGFHMTRTNNFGKQSFQLQQGDMLYFCTDGYADQFGGETGRKFSRTCLREILCSISDLPMEKQKNRLERELKDWMGTNDQIDDITILGIKVE